MGWLPGAVVRDVGAPARFSNGAMHSYTGVVLHVNDADSTDLFGWITGNHDMSCHWQVLKDGTIYQYIDTRFSSWCQSAGNNDYLSIETQGFPNQPLTGAQLAAVARIVAYCHAEHGIPLQVANAPGQRGLGWHGMGGSAWGGHTGCPGDARRAQLPLILAAANPARPNPVFRSGDRLITGQGLLVGQQIVDGPKTHLLVMQGDGNLVVRSVAGGTWHPTWSTRTNNRRVGGLLANHFDVQGDGNLVLYTAARKAVWQSGTRHTGPAALILQADGNVVMRGTNSAVIWQTNTPKT